jgi:hypothetical protein
MPYYLATFIDRQNLLADIRQHILDKPSGSLHNEPRLHLMEELREPRSYFSLLRAIAQRNTRLNEIAQASGIRSAPTASPYLDILQQMRLNPAGYHPPKASPRKANAACTRSTTISCDSGFVMFTPIRVRLILG